MKAASSQERPRDGIPPSLTTHQFTRLVLAGKIVDGRAGGLIFGRTYDEGGVLALFKLGSGYVVQGRIEGGEFAVNWSAATRNLKRLQAMNAGLTIRELTKDLEDGDPPEVTQLIITAARPNDRLVYLHWGQVIVNREATAKHIKELTEMNQAPNPYLNCDLREIFSLDGTEDGVV
jgi:hypothetical protein